MESDLSCKVLKTMSLLTEASYGKNVLVSDLRYKLCQLNDAEFEMQLAHLSERNFVLCRNGYVALTSDGLFEARKFHQETTFKVGKITVYGGNVQVGTGNIQHVDGNYRLPDEVMDRVNAIVNRISELDLKQTEVKIIHEGIEVLNDRSAPKDAYVEAGHSLRNVLEGATGSLVATGIQAYWADILNLLRQFFPG